MDVDSASGLRLSLLNDDLVHAEWKDGYFNDNVAVPVELELHLQTDSIPVALLNLCRGIFSQVETGEVETWPSLVQRGLEFKKCLYLINYLLITASNKLDDERHRTNGILAARLYFSFLVVQCGGPFLIYQPNLLCKAMKVLECGHLLRAPAAKPPGRRRKSGVRVSVDEAQSPAHRILPRSEAEQLKRYLNDGLRDLIKLLQHHENGTKSDATPYFVESLSTIAMQEIVPSDLLSNSITVSLGHSAASLTQNAFYSMLALCHKRYGDVKNTIRIIMKYVCDAFMMGFRKEGEGLANVHVNAVRDIFIDFAFHVCRHSNESAHEGVKILFQHLCVYSPDRAELRLKVVTTTVSLLLRLPQEFKRICCETLVVMSCHPRATVRLFSVEAISKTLNSLEADLCTSQITEDNQYHLQELLFASVVARIQDVSALVASKAINCLVSYLEESSKCAGRKVFISKLFMEPYFGCNSIKDAVTKKFRNFNEVANIIQNGSNLTDIYLPCASSIMSELIGLCKDDIVLVRKSSLQLLCRILHLNFKFMDTELIAVSY